MHKALLGRKLAVLVANGFCEKDLTEMQRALQKTGANVRIVGMDQALVASWNETGWGLNFAADQMLNAALAAEYDLLVIPGGQKSIDKLKLTAHTRRFIGGFLDMRKPVVAFDEAVELLVFAERVSGRTISGPASLQAQVEQAGGTWSGEVWTQDSMLMTGGAAAGSREDYVAEAVAFLTSAMAVDKAA